MCFGLVPGNDRLKVAAKANKVIMKRLLFLLPLIGLSVSAAEPDETVDAAGRIIDLNPYYNIRLDDPTYDGPGTPLPSIKAEFDGLPFQVHGQVVLFGRHFAIRGRHFPTRVKDIPIGSRFDELHLLHHSRWPSVPGERIARIVLQYEDGTTHDFPIVFGDHVRDWHFLPSYEIETLGDPQAKVIWRDMKLSQYKGYRRLWKTIFANPYPQKLATRMDLISDQTYAAYSLIGATIAKSDPTRTKTPHIPFSEKRRFAEIKATIADYSTGKPIARALIEPGVITRGAGVVAEMLRTDKSGKATFKYWKGETTRISWTITADGYIPANRSFRSGSFPASEKIFLRPAIAISGVVEDEDGNPIESAFIYPYNAATSAGRSSVYGAYAVTDQNGRWKLNMMPKGLTEVSLTISHRDFARQSWTLNAADTRKLKVGKYKFTLREGFLFAGQVKDVADHPVENAIVSYGSNTRGAQYRFALTDADGYYTLHIPNDSRITLSVSKKGWKTTSRPFQASAVVPVQDFTLSK